MTNSQRPHRIASRVVLGLRDSPRLGGFFAQPGAQGFRHFEAYDAREGGGEEYFDRDRFTSHYGEPPLGGQVGCAISHHLILKEFANEPGVDTDLLLVAEDDARFLPGFERALDRITRNAGPLDYVNLAEPFARTKAGLLHPYAEDAAMLSLTSRIIGWRGVEPIRMGPFSGRAWGAVCYLVSRAAARRITEVARSRGRLSWLADDFTQWAEPADIRVLLVRPDLVTYDGPSTIESGTLPPRGLTLREMAREGGVISALRRFAAPRRRLRHLARAWRATRCPTGSGGAEATP
ncbi:MAG: glycosyltransferase family 25 protein [Bowdeniella nasicola]|nr:glycosyltransferase family 25 protein [Bowdeniella nasicola]